LALGQHQLQAAKQLPASRRHELWRGLPQGQERRELAGTNQAKVLELVQAGQAAQQEAKYQAQLVVAY
jgi:hypothetical protein